MACARVSRIDLSKAQPFPAHLRKTKSHRITMEMDANHPVLNATTFPDDDLSPRPPDDQEEDFLETSHNNKAGSKKEAAEKTSAAAAQNV